MEAQRALLGWEKGVAPGLRHLLRGPLGGAAGPRAAATVPGHYTVAVTLWQAPGLGTWQESGLVTRTRLQD